MENGDAIHWCDEFGIARLLRLIMHFLSRGLIIFSTDFSFGVNNK